MKKNIFIVGTGGHASSVLGLVMSLGLKVNGFIATLPNPNLNSLYGYPVLQGIEALSKIKRPNVVIAVGDNTKREELSRLVKEITDDNVKFPRLVHPDSTISSGSDIKQGSLILPGARVGTNSKVGVFAILNTNSSLDHNSIMEDYSSLAPAAATGGAVYIGNRTAILMNASISHGVIVGRDVVLGANSFLRQNTGDSELWVGIPAKRIRSRIPNEAYL